MREFKFRAWDKKYNEMIPDLICFYKDGGISHNNHFNSDISPFRGYMWDSRNLEIMQYTGLTDKNGVEVCEGDVGNDKFNNKVIVKWNEQFYCHALLTIDEVVKDDWNFDLNDLNEIVGNIYENPELLRNNK